MFGVLDALELEVDPPDDKAVPLVAAVAYAAFPILGRLPAERYRHRDPALLEPDPSESLGVFDAEDLGRHRIGPARNRGVTTGETGSVVGCREIQERQAIGIEFVAGARRQCRAQHDASRGQEQPATGLLLFCFIFHIRIIF